MTTDARLDPLAALEALRASLAAEVARREHVEALLLSLVTDIKAEMGDRYRAVVDEAAGDISVNTAFKVALQDEREQAHTEVESLTLALQESQDELKVHIEQLAALVPLREQIAQASVTACTLHAEVEELRQERDHERHEKETVADASQAVVRHLRQERDKEVGHCHEHFRRWLAAEQARKMAEAEVATLKQPLQEAEHCADLAEARLAALMAALEGLEQALRARARLNKRFGFLALLADRLAALRTGEA